MTSASAQEPADKREALKFRNRHAIVTAAAELARAHGVHGFTVNDLAERAGVSRRTIFNHVDSVEDAVFASYTDRLLELGREFDRQLGDRTFATADQAFSAISEAGAQVDVIQAVLEALSPFTDGEHAALPPQDGSGPFADRAEVWAARMQRSLTAAIRETVGRRWQDPDPFEMQLLVEQFLGAMGACVRRWFAATDRTLSAENLRLWNRLVSTALRRLSTGYAAD